MSKLSSWWKNGREERLRAVCIIEAIDAIGIFTNSVGSGGSSSPFLKIQS